VLPRKEPVQATDHRSSGAEASARADDPRPGQHGVLNVWADDLRAALVSAHNMSTAVWPPGQDQDRKTHSGRVAPQRPAQNPCPVQVSGRRPRKRRPRNKRRGALFLWPWPVAWTAIHFLTAKVCAKRLDWRSKKCISFPGQTGRQCRDLKECPALCWPVMAREGN